jgi:hypothetical protein
MSVSESVPLSDLKRNRPQLLVQLKSGLERVLDSGWFTFYGVGDNRSSSKGMAAIC